MKNSNNEKTEETSQVLTEEQKRVDEFGKQLYQWLYSDPDYAHRLMHEGSGNW